MVEILRNKWCEDLEDLLQCPICMICPTNTYIYQCTEGHHICHVCKSKVGTLCPTCGNSWTAYRNRLAEHMCYKFEDIKSSLIDPEAKINKLLIPDKLCVETQTDTVEGATIKAIGATAEIADLIASRPDNQIAKGHNSPYPCSIGSCKVKLCFKPLINHIKSMHPSVFSELTPEDGMFFECCWPFCYTDNAIFERVFRIPDIGTFILKLCTDKWGDLSAYIMMINSGSVSKLFWYRLSLTSGTPSDTPTFSGNVNSCRSPATTFEKQCLRVKRIDIEKMIKGTSDLLTCTLLLTRTFQLDEAQLPKTHGRNRKRAKNRNKSAEAPILSIINI